MAPRGRPRLIDLAQRLGVAPSTVSRALAGSPSVSESTRQRVVEAAEELGYMANPAASGLKSGQTSSIGLIAVMSYWYSGAVTTGADRVAADHGYDFVVMNAVGGLDRDVLVHRARRLGQRVDGALVIDIAEGELLDTIIDALGVPVVTIGCRTPDVSALVVDNVEVGALAARRLQAAGHTTASALMPANPSPLAYDNASVRSDGFVAAFGPGARAATLDVSPNADRRRAIVDAVGDASAVFCVSDALAIEAIAALRTAGRAVPDDVSVIGVDDHPLAEAVGLTTIAQQPEAMGERATEMVISAARGARSDVICELGAIRLVERDTARAANSDRAINPH